MAKDREWIENIDSWIKQIKSEFSQITDVSNVVKENVDNIQHNYELIYALKDEIDKLNNR